MKILVEKSGGLVGQTIKGELDTNDLSVEELQSFNQLEKVHSSEERMRDGYTYHFSYTDQQKTVEVDMSESMVTVEMIPFLKKVEEKMI